MCVCVCRLDQIMGFKAGNLRANMYFYKIIGHQAPNHAVVSSIDMYNNDVGKRFMK